MEAPEIIWLSPNEYRSNEPSCFWSESQRTDYDIEYIRKDAFIEKACKWLEDKLYDYAGEDDKRNIVPFDNAIFHDFKKAMEEQL